MRPRRSPGFGLALALLSAGTFATSGTFARSLLEAGWSAEAVVAARVGIASLVLAVPAVVALRGRWVVLRRNVRAVAAFGLFAVAGAQVGFFNAMRYVPIGVAVLLEYLGIILVVLWMWSVHGQRPHRLTVAGAAASVLGLVFVLDLTGARIELLGMVWGLLAAVGLATYFVLSARIDAELPSVVVAGGGMATGSAVLLSLGAIGALPLHATFGDVTFVGWRVSWLGPILGLSIVAAVVAYLAGIGAARILGPRLASFVGLTEVLFAVLLAWLLLDERLTMPQIVGGGLIVAGVALVRADEMRGAGVRPGRDDDAALTRA